MFTKRERKLGKLVGFTIYYIPAFWLPGCKLILVEAKTKTWFATFSCAAETWLQPLYTMDVCHNLTKCSAEKHHWATWYPAAASRGPVIVGFTVTTRRHWRYGAVLSCHSWIMLGNLWLQCGGTPMLTWTVKNVTVKWIEHQCCDHLIMVTALMLRLMDHFSFQ